MELCKDTLADFIESRNKKFNPKCKKVQTHEDMISGVDLEYSLNLFDKILQGVEYIHNKENLIHRDIKPKNIFFSFDNHIKIGDLGLATNSLNTKCEMLCPSPILDRSMNKDDEAYLDAYNESKDDLALDSSFRLEIEETVTSSPVQNQKSEIHKGFKFSTEEEVEIHTSNIGTSQYAAPEQLNNNYYNNKVDIYPLGIIMLELIYPFNTRMEKHETLEILNNKKMLPKVICENFPKITELILLMTDADSERRPNITQCRSLFKDILNDMKKINDKKLNLLEKRKRFMSEDIQGVKSFEFQFKLPENEDWKSW
jgi:serine/threonine protein kinase